MSARKVRSILFKHSGERKFTIECADPGREFCPVGDIQMVVLPDGRQAWYCVSRAGERLLVRFGRLNAFPGAWEAAEWLVRWHNNELDESDKPSMDISLMLEGRAVE
jgi:hypothetical protein